MLKCWSWEFQIWFDLIHAEFDSYVDPKDDAKIYLKFGWVDKCIEVGLIQKLIEAEILRFGVWTDLIYVKFSWEIMQKFVLNTFPEWILELDWFSLD